MQLACDFGLHALDLGKKELKGFKLKNELSESSV